MGRSRKQSRSRVRQGSADRASPGGVEERAQQGEPLKNEGEELDQEPEPVNADVVEEDEAAFAVPLQLPPSAGEHGEKGPLARYDPLQAYMRDVQRYRLLTPEEEQQTAIRYYETGDVEAAARLVTSNLRLVVKIAYDYRHAYKNIMDVVQEGNIGLMQAVKKYDPYKGVKLSTYAAWWIRAYILRFILNNARLVKVGTTQAQRKLFFNLKKEKARLTAMGIEPTAEIIARRLDVPRQEVIDMDRRLSAGDLSLDAPVRRNSQGSQTRGELLQLRARRVDDLLADEELGNIFRQKLDEFATTLKGKEKLILEQRLLADDPRTLQDLGEEFGVSRERVRQLEKRLQQKLKAYLTETLGEGVFDA
jgi:RNA polymerase sigma-32 factor